MIEASRNQSLDNSTSNTNTDTESISESGMSESEGEEHININDLRVPLEKGWRRETVIRGLTKSGHIKGDVFYYPPQSVNKMKGMNQIQLVRVICCAKEDWSGRTFANTFDVSMMARSIWTSSNRVILGAITLASRRRRSSVRSCNRHRHRMQPMASISR